MLENKQIYILSLVLCLVGLSLFAYKWLYLNVPLKPGVSEPNWLIEAKLIFFAKGQPAKIKLSIPSQQPNFSIINENFISPDYGIVTKLDAYNRTVIWTKRKAQGRETLYYRINLRPRSKPIAINYSKAIILENLASDDLSEAEQAAINAIIEDAKAKSADTTSLVSRIIQVLNQPKHNNAASLLKGNYSNAKIATVAANILVKIGIIALPIQGLLIGPLHENIMITWLMVKDKNTWLYFDPATGDEGLPNNFLIWHIGTSRLYTVQGGKYTKLTLSISKTVADLEGNISDLVKKSKLSDFSLKNLPLPSQMILKIFLLIPIGALIILFFRNYIGLPTFGTFMPVLISISFFNMDLFWGVFLFILIVSFGLLIRFYLDKLNLLLVPRLAAVLVAVVLFITTLSVILHKLELDSTATVALFPIVILTMTIEKMCNIWDERGAKDAIKTGLASLFVAVVAFLIIQREFLQYLFFTFPELNLVILGLILLFGQYRGFRLTELRRFSTLVKK